MDDKWNGQAAPNNNNKASDMKFFRRSRLKPFKPR